MIARRFIKLTIDRASCDDFNEVLACVGDLNRLVKIRR